MEGISSKSVPRRRRPAGPRLLLRSPPPVRPRRISGCTTFGTSRSHPGPDHRTHMGGGSEAAPPSLLRRVTRGGADGGGMSSSRPDPGRDDSSSEALVDGGEVHGAPVRDLAPSRLSR